jgi:hypothetical protein
LLHDAESFLGHHRQLLRLEKTLLECLEHFVAIDTDFDFSQFYASVSFVLLDSKRIQNAAAIRSKLKQLRAFGAKDSAALSAVSFP